MLDFLYIPPRRLALGMPAGSDLLLVLEEHAMLVNPGEKLHIVTRLRFEGDLRRHFVGEVVQATETLVRLRGYAFVFDPWANAYVRKPEERERIVPLGDAGLILTLLPPNVELDALQYRMTPETQLMLSDGNGFSLDINEFSARR